MQLERRSRPRYGIALTSLVDVVFILLFFFMLAARAQPPAALELRLAQLAAAASTVPVVDVLGGGRLRSANREFTIEALAAQTGGAAAVRLRAMPGSELQDLIDALDAARSAGLSADWVR